MRWYHPIEGPYGSFTNKLLSISARHWKPIPYELNQIGGLPLSRVPSIQPETSYELIENLALAAHRKFPKEPLEKRFCKIDPDGRLNFSERGSIDGR